ncbi:MAG: sugar ABC transporter substrate-binding protein [Solirubrobacterales bacterium]|nr:sugar ABC transporter substrate-binding protein [Solirubrobacterales bacterium]
MSDPTIWESGHTRKETLRYGAAGLVGLSALDLFAASGAAAATHGSEALAAARRLAPWDSTRPKGPATGLPRRIAWANTAAAEFFLALTAGMKDASKRRKMDFVTAISGNDPAKNIEQMESFLARGVGTLMMQPLDLATQRPVMIRALKAGICVEGLITFPTTLQIAASQYTVGYTQGKAAADYAKKRLGGKAEVLYMNLDSLAPALVVRHKGVLAGLKTGGSGVKVVSDQGVDVSVETGFKVMSTVIQAKPNIKIVLGGDSAVIGAYQALDQAGKLSNDMYLSGVDGDSQALALVKKGGAYKASIAFAWKLMGYGLGQFGADWIEGKSIPRVMVAAPILLDSPAKVRKYESDSANPAATFASRARYEKYLPLLGNVSYATRKLYWKKEYVPA